MKTKLLLVEHNAFIKDALQRALEIEGYYVLSVTNALDGLKVAKREAFEVVVADYELPDATGLEFFMLINRFCPHSVKILMTTYGELKTLTGIHDYGVDNAVEKPFPFENLVVAIEESLRKKNLNKQNGAGRKSTSDLLKLKN